jgi:hypothetical protein
MAYGRPHLEHDRLQPALQRVGGSREPDRPGADDGNSSGALHL